MTTAERAERERLVAAVTQAHYLEKLAFAMYDEIATRTVEAENALATFDAAHKGEG